VEVDVSAGAGSIAASNVAFSAAGDIGSTNVQGAIEEVSSECRNADNITSGTLAVARGGTGLASYAKGDLIAASGATTLAKLPVGTNTHVLRANSSTATGLEWGADFTGTVTDVTSSTTALTVATSTTTPALTIRAATTSVNGIVQLSDSTSTTSSILAATPTAVKSAYDLAALALPKAGGTVTGDITLGTNVGIQFEGTTDDANEIRLIGADATEDRTITLPNVTGTVVTTGDSGTVTSAMIANDSIVDADINASAAIAYSKLALSSGIVNTDISASAAIALSKLATGALPTGITIASGNIVDGTITNADINASAGIVYSKLALSSGIVNTDISASAAIALSKLATGALPTGITVSSGNIVDGTIVNADINASAAIADTKLDTISTAGKVSGTAITSGTIATNGNLAIANTAPRIFLTESDGTATHSRTVLNRDSNEFSIKTRSSTDSLVSTDYAIDVDASGATDHIWRIANTEKARLDSTGLTVVNNIITTGHVQTNRIQNEEANEAIVLEPSDDSIQFITNGSEAARITSGRDFLVGTTVGIDLSSNTSNGHSLVGGGAAVFARASNPTVLIARNTNDGTLVGFYQGGTQEGTISVAGSTVSYNPFLGSHWGRLVDGSKPDILPGTILDTVDQLIEWKQSKFTVDGEEKIAAYNGSAEAGDIVQIVYEGTSYSAIVQNEEEEPEELNKHVCVKVNDIASSKAVFGVFLGWDDDIPDGMVSTWNDLYCAAVGNYFVRIAEGEALEIGSLIEADGNGCGIVQDDDIIRSKTVAKITSTIPQKVYDDGSFLVTCVLCCG
jgi:uncharacterized protein YdbL (DUF1318 family)